jgi:hypothetical protein
MSRRKKPATSFGIGAVAGDAAIAARIADEPGLPSSCDLGAVAGDAAIAATLRRKTPDMRDFLATPETAQQAELIQLQAELTRQAIREELGWKPVAALDQADAPPQVFTGNKRKLLKQLGWSRSYGKKLTQLEDAQAITLEPIESATQRGEWRMTVLVPRLAYNRQD